MTASVKICGLKNREDVEAANTADFIGFIFHEKSPRNVTVMEASDLATYARVPVVAVTVNADDAFLRAINDAVNPDYFQLHGNESPARVAEVKKTFRKPVIKAFSVSAAEDISAAASYETIADIFMFDAKSPGSGTSFDWSLLAGRTFKKPWFLSGGLTPANVADALRITRAPLVDVSSGVESAPGVKDVALIKEFIRTVKSL